MPLARAAALGVLISLIAACDLPVETGLAQDALGEGVAHLLLDALLKLGGEHICRRHQLADTVRRPSCASSHSMNCGVVIAFSSTRWVCSHSSQIRRRSRSIASAHI